MDRVGNLYVQNTGVFCLYGTFLPVTRSFHQFRIRRHLICELICESAKICTFQKSRINLDVLVLPQLPNSCVPLPCHPLRMCAFRVTCAETPLGEFAISLVLVISCEPVNVETESMNFSSLEVQRVAMFTDGNKSIIPVPIFLPMCLGTSPF